MKNSKAQKNNLIFGCIFSIANTILFPYVFSIASGMSSAGDGFGRSIEGLVNGFYIMPIIFIAGISLTVISSKSQNKKSKLLNSLFVLYVLFLPLIFILGLLFGLNDPRTPLMQAASKGDVVRVNEILKNSSTDIDKEVLFNGQQTDALREAIANDHFDIVEILIRNGADPNNEKYPHLVYAARLGRYEITKLLVANGAEIGKVAFFGDDALTAASGKGQFRTVELLVANNAISKSKDRAHNAVATACSHGHSSIVKYLINNGADDRQIKMEDCK